VATLPRSPGVYKGICRPTTKLYIGSSVNVHKRVGEHTSRLRRGIHSNPHLQNAWEMYGEAAFEWEVIEETTIDELLTAEQYYLDQYQAYDRRFGFNTRTQAESNYGLAGPQHSDEVRQRLSESKRGNRNPMWGKPGEQHPNYGKPRSAETTDRWKQAYSSKDRSQSEEERERRSRANKGKKRLPETIARLAAAAIRRFGNPETNPNVGKRRTPEQRAKIGRGRAKCYIVTHPERGAFFVRDMKAFCAVQGLHKGKMCTACTKGAYYRDYSVRYATEDEIQTCLPYLGEDGYITL